MPETKPPPGGTPPNDISYADAVAELEQLLLRIEEAEIDVDALSAAVERAAHLLQVCRERIEKAETRIVQVLADIEREAPGPDE